MLMNYNKALATKKRVSSITSAIIIFCDSLLESISWETETNSNEHLNFFVSGKPSTSCWL